MRLLARMRWYAVILTFKGFPARPQKKLTGCSPTPKRPFPGNGHHRVPAWYSYYWYPNWNRLSPPPRPSGLGWRHLVRYQLQWLHHQWWANHIPPRHYCAWGPESARGETWLRGNWAGPVCLHGNLAGERRGLRGPEYFADDKKCREHLLLRRPPRMCKGEVSRACASAERPLSAVFRIYGDVMCFKVFKYAGDS
jgi:hypothetical protein